MKEPKNPRALRHTSILGMPFGTAQARLRKAIMFHLATKAGLLCCFHCKNPIETVADFSIEHKEPWELATNGKELFFDLENISFSHLRCNVGAAKRTRQKYATKQEKHRAAYEALKANSSRHAAKVERRRKRRHKAQKLGLPYH